MVCLWFFQPTRGTLISFNVPALDLLSRNSRLAKELGHNGANMIKTTLTWNHTRRRLSHVLLDLKQAPS